MGTTLLSVALGGAIGASLRYLTNVSVMRIAGPGFPYGTIIANVLGSFAMGVLVVVRTFLAWSLVVELEGRWPWQQARGGR